MNYAKRIDLCADVGGSFGKHTIGEDDMMLRYVTSANIDCGWHGGDPVVMDRTVRLSKEHRVNIGAHPGFPDLLGFGQRNMDCSHSEIFNYVLYQIGALKAFCVAHQTELTHVKMAGNLYLMAVEKPDVARVCAEAVATFDSKLFFLALAGRRGDSMAEAARGAGLRVVREFFADRAYANDGQLVSRRIEGSLISDPMEAAQRVLKVINDNNVEAIDGTEIAIKAHTICLHSFQAGSGKMAAVIREHLEANGIILTSLTDLV